MTLPESHSPAGEDLLAGNPLGEKSVRMALTVRAALAQAALRLAAAGVANPRLDARLLLAHAEGLTQPALLGDPARRVDDAAFQALVARRVAREPIAYILGRQEFWSLSFQVSPATLIPRADSETLIEAALTAFPDRNRVRSVLDLGTGTGCLLLAALSEFRPAWGVGVDVVPAAAALAARNARSVGFHARTAMLCGDWDGAVSGRFDLVLCNPPYIPSGDVEGLMVDVAMFEPRRALAAGRDGLLDHGRVMARLPHLLRPGGVGILELGAGQLASVSEMAAKAGLADHWSRADLAGIPRAFCVRAPI